MTKSTKEKKVYTESDYNKLQYKIEAIEEQRDRYKRDLKDSEKETKDCMESYNEVINKYLDSENSLYNYSVGLWIAIGFVILFSFSTIAAYVIGSTRGEYKAIKKQEQTAFIKECKDMKEELKKLKETSIKPVGV